MFPSEPDPTGDPETWTREDMRRWLAAVCAIRVSRRREYVRTDY